MFFDPSPVFPFFMAATMHMTFETSQEFRDWLKALAWLNISVMSITEETSHPEMFWLKESAFWNIAPM